MDGVQTITFPTQIGFLDVAEYVNQFKSLDPSESYILDLRNTISIHSSFIGFLIHTKHTIQKEQGNLMLLLSFTVEKIFLMLDIIDYFAPEITIAVSMKSA